MCIHWVHSGSNKPKFRAVITLGCKGRSEWAKVVWLQRPQRPKCDRVFWGHWRCLTDVLFWTTQVDLRTSVASFLSCTIACHFGDSWEWMNESFAFFSNVLSGLNDPLANCYYFVPLRKQKIPPVSFSTVISVTQRPKSKWQKTTSHHTVPFCVLQPAHRIG